MAPPTLAVSIRTGVMDGRFPTVLRLPARPASEFTRMKAAENPRNHGFRPAYEQQQWVEENPAPVPVSPERRPMAAALTSAPVRGSLCVRSGRLFAVWKVSYRLT